MAAELSTWDVMKMALWSSDIEAIRADGNGRGSMGSEGAARGVTIARNILYVGITLFVIGIIGTAINGSIIFPVMATVGAICVFVGGQKLYDLAESLQGALNALNPDPAVNPAMPAFQNAVAQLQGH